MMINTIEVAPGILAASLADKLSETFYIYRAQEFELDDNRVSRHELREFIRDFLTDKEKSETMLGR